MPYEATIKKFNLDVKRDLNKSFYVWKPYPIETIKLLNVNDPSRKIYFCLLDFNGKETENTNWFKGMAQADEIINLKRENRELRGYNEKLRADNFLMKTNVQKYIKDNMADSLQMFMPAIRSLVKAEESGMSS